MHYFLMEKVFKKKKTGGLRFIYQVGIKRKMLYSISEERVEGHRPPAGRGGNYSYPVGKQLTTPTPKGISR